MIYVFDHEEKFQRDMFVSEAQIKYAKTDLKPYALMSTNTFKQIMRYLTGRFNVENIDESVTPVIFGYDIAICNSIKYGFVAFVS